MAEVQWRATALLAAFVAIRPVGQQPEVAKEHVNIGAVGDWRWRRGSVGGLETLYAFARRFPPPQHLAFVAVQADGEKAVALECGDKDVVRGEDRRGVSPRQCRSPEKILLRAKVLRKSLGGRDARAVRTAKLRPIGTAQSELHQQTDKPAHQRLVYTGAVQP